MGKKRIEKRSKVKPFIKVSIAFYFGGRRGWAAGNEQIAEYRVLRKKRGAKSEGKL